MVSDVLIDPVICGRLCLTLLHSVWQVTLLFTLAVVIDRLFKKRSVERSYSLYVGTLLIALSAMPVTYSLPGVADRQDAPLIAANSHLTHASTADSNVVAPARTIPDQVNTSWPAETLNAGAVVADARESLSTPISASIVSRWLDAAPWIIACYLIGVVAMCTRLFVAVLKAHRIGAQATPLTDGPLIAIILSLATKWSMKVVPVLAEPERIMVPQVVGLFRPTILLPASVMTGLTVDELELILTHELAHVRRHDMWISLVQRLAETVLFFNPALWLLNRRISTLREYCCDDITCRTQAPSHTEPQLRYARALLRIAENSRPAVSLHELASLSSAGHSPSELRRRVARLLGEPLREPLCISRGTMLTFVALVVALVLSPAILPTQAENATDNAPSAYVPRSDSTDAVRQQHNANNTTQAPGLPAFRQRPRTKADERVAAARALTAGVAKLRQLKVAGTYWSTDSVGMLNLPELSFAKFWEFRSGSIDVKQGHERKITMCWNSHKLAIRNDFTFQDGSGHIDYKHWSDSEGWQVDLSRQWRNFVRYKSLDQLFSPGRPITLEPYLQVFDNHLPWPGPPIKISYGVSPLLTRYQPRGTELVDGVLCEVYDGPERQETIWIDSATGLIKAVFGRSVHQQHPDLHNKASELVGQSFSSTSQFENWLERQPENVRSEVVAWWARMHWPLSDPWRLLVFSDYRQISPGVFWPHHCEHLRVHSTVRNNNGGFNCIRGQFVTEEISLNAKPTDVLGDDVQPGPGDTIYDQRFSESVNYPWNVDPAEMELLAARAIKEIRDAQTETRKIEQTPINSVDDAITILLEVPDVDPPMVWAHAIKYLVDHKDEAFPRLIKQLDAEHRDHPISKLAFSLRAIGDARAVPALIRALPRTLQKSRSDYGLQLNDSELCGFMQRHSCDGKTDNETKEFDYGRAFREVTTALHRLTGQNHDEMELNRVHLAATKPQRRLQRQLFFKAALRWADWWESDWQKLIDDKAYAKVNLPALEANRTGATRFIQPPTGPGVELQHGVVGKIVRSAHETTRNVFVDLDTGREADWPDALPPPQEIDFDSPKLLEWAQTHGFDMVGVSHTPQGETVPLYCLQPLAMNVWQVSEEQHRRLQQSISSEEPYPLSRPVTMMVPTRQVPQPYDYDYSGTAFLFVTSEGTAGLIRMTGQVTNTNVVSGVPVMLDDQFSAIGFHRGAKISISTMTEPTAAPGKLYNGAASRVAD